MSTDDARPDAGADDEDAGADDEAVDETLEGSLHDRRRRMPTWAIVVVAALVLLAIPGAAWLNLQGGDGSGTADRSAAPTTTAPPTTQPPTTEPEGPPPALIATTQVPEIEAFDAPAEDAGVVTTLADRTDYGVPRTFLVLQERGEWVEVLLPVRPNGTRGWIRAAEVTLATTTYSVKVELGAHKVTLYDAGDPIVETAAVVGTPDTPTPVGTFYVTDPVDLQDDPDGAYGAFALGLSGFSEVLYEFAGGPGQLALHGTNRPELLGQDVSNGCVRVPNDVILQIAERLPLGTPVEIVA